MLNCPKFIADMNASANTYIDDLGGKASEAKNWVRSGIGADLHWVRSPKNVMKFFKIFDYGKGHIFLSCPGFLRCHEMISQVY